MTPTIESTSTADQDGRAGGSPSRLRQDVLVTAGGPYITVEEPSFTARFLLDPGTDTEGSVANVDAIVDLPDGSSWALTLLTVDEMSRLLKVWRETGEVAYGSYFWAADQVIVPVSGIEAMTTAIRELVRSGELSEAGI
jgi:hypothetical protein